VNKLAPLLISGVLLFGAVACDGGAKTAGGPNSDTTKTAESPSSGASSGTSPEATPSASPNTAAGGTSANTNDAAKPDNAAKQDATSDVRRAQANSDIRAREQRNNAGGDTLKRADGDLESEVRSKLEVNLPKSKLEVKAKDGAVTVSGAVASQDQLGKIETLTKQIKGVKSVVNQAKVVAAKK